MIVPTGIATDSSTSAFFGDLIDSGRIISLYDFQTGQGFFDRIGHARFKFCILTVMGNGGHSTGPATFVFFIRQLIELDQKERFFSLSPEQIAKINPNTKTAPVFRTRMDAELTAKLYSHAPVLIEERPADLGGDMNPWGITFQAMFHMSGDSDLFATCITVGRRRAGFATVRTGFRTSDDIIHRRVPLYEAKMVHHFDHRWATFDNGAIDDDGARDVTIAEKQHSNFEPSPRYWVPEYEVKLRSARVPASLKRAFRETNPSRCLKSLAEWLNGYFASVEERAAARRGPQRAFSVVIMLGGRSWVRRQSDFCVSRSPSSNGDEMQRETPLSSDDLHF